MSIHNRTAPYGQRLGYCYQSLQEIAKIVRAISDEPDTPRIHRLAYEVILKQIGRCEMHGPEAWMCDCGFNHSADTAECDECGLTRCES